VADLHLEREDLPGARILRPVGWVDISNVSTLSRAVEDALGPDGAPALGLDLARAEYIDSATVSALIRAKSLADEAERPFALVGLSEQVQRVLEETHLITIFEIHPDAEAFLAGLGEGQPSVA